MIKRWLLGAALVSAVLVVAGFQISPPAPGDELPRTITVEGVVHERAHLVTFRSYPGEKRVSVSVPATSRPILVRAACRLAFLHRRRALSALSVQVWWMRDGGNVADLPDTGGNEYLWCDPGSDNQRLAQTIDPSWLPGEDGRRHLIWHEMPTVADTPSDAPASWALAVYTAS
ncbi:hypothetical protein Adi01nite_51730 [Amorphoplanes digitatis]|nr:hypothetical protein Adi01nite_51730 [Actinoplanes digitatis]